MGKCLVTKLIGIVNNDSLLRVGEIRFSISAVSNPTSESQKLSISYSTGSSLEIIGNGYFTDSTLSQNLGKSRNVNEGSNTVYVSNGNFSLIAKNKYNIESITIGNAYSFNIDDVKWSNLYNITANYTNTEGDISSLASITRFETIDLSYTKVAGDIASLSKLTNSKMLSFICDRVRGNLSSLHGLTKLQLLRLKNVSGDVSSLVQNKDLSDIRLYKSNITGDIATLSPKLHFMDFGDSITSLSFGSRDTASYIIALDGFPHFDNIDSMLINQAKCTATSGSKLISASGKRTSASDAAVQTLQQKGYTVSINPA